MMLANHNNIWLHWWIHKHELCVVPPHFNTFMERNTAIHVEFMIEKHDMA